MEFINAQGIDFEYSFYDSEKDEKAKFKAIDNLDIAIKKGEFICILGHNGSGKSTLARHMNALLTPTKNTIWINQIDSKDSQKLWDIRKSVGMVFQNPDNQIVATTIEEDVAFGLENLGVEPSEIKKRVEESLEFFDLLDYKESLPSNLSGGQKQKVAIAGILAMQPECIVFDEATAMLDPLARDDFIKTLKTLNEKKDITIVLITHHMEEVIYSDRVVVMKNGKIVLDKTPRELFSEHEKLRELKLDFPEITKISYELNSLGYGIKKVCLETDELLQEIKKIGFNEKIIFDEQSDRPKKEEIIAIKNLDYSYLGDGYLNSKNTSKSTLSSINLFIKKGEILGIIGHTGSGKSTLIKHLNGLIKPKENTVFFNGKDILSQNLKEIRQKVGLVFQYPEMQIFEETVYKDVAFAPKNMQLSEEEIDRRVKKSLDFVGLYENFYLKNPFELSGGQKRRVAIAGILAMEPEVLVFDEPTAGIDPLTKKLILENIKKINREFGVTIILISHSMEDICQFADRVAVMNCGKLELCDSLENIFNDYEKIDKFNLKLPKITELFLELNKIDKRIPTSVFTLQEAKEFFIKNLKQAN